MKRAASRIFIIFTIIFFLFTGYGVYRIFSTTLGHTSESVVTDAKNVTSETTSYTQSIGEMLSPISISYLRMMAFEGSKIQIEEVLSDGSNYKQYIASYLSDGNKIFGLLTVPKTEVPEGGFSAIVFNHGYVPPSQYVTTEKYVSYVDYLAKNGFVVFKIDLRGHGQSEGSPAGSYFSNGYTIDAINAVRSLQKYEPVNPEKIGIWGHSMSGNLVLRSMLVSDDIKAGVIFAGAVYSYEDFGKYRINDSSYSRRPSSSFPSARPGDPDDLTREISEEVQKLRETPDLVDFSSEFWSSISLTKNIEHLNSPLQIHHAKNDFVVNIGYSRDLVEVLDQSEKTFEYYEYEGGGHNITSPYFEEAMSRVVEFYKENL